jgi:hypothetical protein
VSEYELREALQLAVADEPPMTFNLDDLVTNAERLTRRRRALVAVGAGTAAVAVAAVTVPVVLGIARVEPAVLPVAGPGISISAPATSQQPKAPTVQELTTRGQEMQAYLRTRFPEVVKGATGVDVRPFGGEAEGQIFDGQQYLTGTVRFTLNGTTSAIILEMHSAADDPQKSDCPACDLRTQPDGTTVRVRTEKVDELGGTVTIATHLRADGSTVAVNTYNYDPTGPGRGITPLSVDEVVSLAADPNLHL